MKRILVVDDDAMNLKLAGFALKQYEVHTADSGIECLDFLAQEEVDLVLLDVEMPVMNGIKTLESIREKENLKELPVMFLTADEEIEKVAREEHLSVQGYVKKPFLPQALLDKVKEILAD
ncbi:MAG: response regulator [Lachnospiraceae bacterium]|nr:response regulator [Lachnospiraceae bacterium]